MIVVLFLVLLGLALVFRNRIALWITTKRMAYRHQVTLMKIDCLKSLHEIGFL